MSYNSLEEIVRECQEKDLPFDEVILLDDMNERNVSREESIETMRGMWEAMKGAERNYDGSLQSRSGLVGGAGKTMRAYVESGEPMDKAGAYGIQGKGARFVEQIEGDYYTVMGLPVCKLYHLMRELGLVSVPLSPHIP